MATGDNQPFLFRMMGHLFQDLGSVPSFPLPFKLCGLNPSVYKGHTFRIGAASHAAERGMSDAQIRILGRSKFNAFLKYIKISFFKLTA